MQWQKYKLLVVIREGDDFEHPIYVTESVGETERVTGIDRGRIYYSIRTGRFILGPTGFVRIVDCTGDSED